MANLKDIYELKFENAPDWAESEEDITTKSGKIAVFDDTSAIGYLNNDSEITELLYGNFVPNNGLELEAIDFETYKDKILLYTAWFHNQDKDHWHGSQHLIGKYGFIEMGNLRATLNSLGLNKTISDEILSKYGQALATVQANNPEAFKNINEQLSDEKVKKTAEKIKNMSGLYSNGSIPPIFSDGIEESSIWDMTKQ